MRCISAGDFRPREELVVPAPFWIAGSAMVQLLFAWNCRDLSQFGRDG
jgi:hypothetical protein